MYSFHFEKLIFEFVHMLFKPHQNFPVTLSQNYNASKALLGVFCNKDKK